MTEEYNQNLKTGVIPDEWLRIYLIPLLKIGRDNTEAYKNENSELISKNWS